MRNILHLIKGLGRGGAEQLLLSAAPYLDRTRFRHEMAYVLPHKNFLVPGISAAGIPVHCLGNGSGRWAGNLRKLVRTHGIDLVHTHSPYVATISRLVLGRRIKHVHTEHNVWDSYGRATYWGNLMTFASNGHVFAVSENVRASIRYPSSLGFLSMPPVETLYHGLDPATLQQWDATDGVRKELGVSLDAPLFGTVANFRPQKAHGDLIRAAVRVREAVPTARLVLVGQGPKEQDVRRQVGELGLQDMVVFAGQRDDAPRVARSFDVFVLPSRYEGLAIALLEAMALGRPSVVTAVGGLSELVEDGINGLVVPPANPEALAQVIVSLLLNSDLRSRLGEAARKRAAHFDIRKAVGRVEQVYQELLS
jgi:glycosyltransferase involved in cell wall biosynthesis